MLTLPRELLSSIFSFLLPNSALLERKFRFNYFEHRRLVLSAQRQALLCSAVCRDFRDAILPPSDLASPAKRRQPKSWVFQDENDPLVDWFKLTVNLPRRPGVLRLNLHGCSTLSSDMLVSILVVCPQLDRLDLHGCESIDARSLKNIGLKCPLVTWLNLRGVVRANDLALKQLFTDLKKGLVFLDLSHIWRIGNLSLSSLACTASARTLQQLFFAGNRAGSEGVNALIESCSSMTELDIAGNRDVNDSIVSSVKQSSSLKWIDLRGTGVTDTFATDMGHFRPQLKLSIL